MLVNRFQDAGKYKKELCILVRRLTWIKKVDSVICCNGPVVMFTGSVNSCERFLVKQAFQSVLAGYSLQCLHCQLVLVYRNVRLCINRSQFVLCRCNLIMLCLSRNTNFPKLDIYISHEGCDSLTDCSEVMIIKLLSFRRHCSKECTSCVDQVFSFFKLLCIYKEVLLLCSNRWSNFLRCCISK